MSSGESLPSSLPDGELQGWMDAWKGGDAPADGGLDAEERQRLRSRARRSTLLVGALAVVEGLLTVGAIAWTLHRALESGAAQDWALFTIVLSLLVGIFGVTMWNRRGTWRPYDRSTRSYLDLEILRARRKLITTTRVLPAVLIIEIALLVPWKIWVLASDPEITSLGPPMLRLVLWLAGISIVVMSVARFVTHRTRADLKRLLCSRESLDDPDIEARL